jgi:hypothetical protein
MMGRITANAEVNLQVTDVSGNSVYYTYDQLLAMPKTTTSAALYCYGVLKTGGTWGGVSLGYLLEQVSMNQTSYSTSFIAQDGYQVNLPLSFALRPDVIIAYEKDGSPLPEGLRLVLPGENGNLWISMITRISMSTLEVSLNQPVIIPPLPLRGVFTHTDLTGQQSTQQPEPVQTQPTATPRNTTIIEPVVPPANVTQPAQKASVPQGSSAEGLGFPLVALYGIGLGIIIALVAVGYVAYGHRRVR